MADADDDISPWRSLPAKVAPVALALAALGVAGFAIAPLTDGASRATHPRNFDAAKAPPAELGAEGFMISLGGLRTLAADAAWLRANVMWEKTDRAACTAYARLAAVLSPENASFREGYANWMAFDFPHWSIARLGGYATVPQKVQDGLFRAEGLEALKYLEVEMAREPEQYRYPMLASRIVLIRLKDAERAAMFNRRAAETPAGPWSPALNYANHLANTGRLREAVDWLGHYAGTRPENSMSRAVAEEWLEPARKELKKRTE